MFPLPWPIVVFFLAVYLAIALAVCVGYALLVNLICQTPIHRYLLSSALVGLGAYIATTLIGLQVLPPLSWVNEIPQDLRTTLWDHLHIISCVAGVLAITFWRLIVRARRRFLAQSPI